MTQPEALRLADALRDSVETDGEWSQEQVVAAAAELRRLAKVEAQRDALLAALERSRGQWIHSVNADQCLAAIAKAQQ